MGSGTGVLSRVLTEYSLNDPRARLWPERAYAPGVARSAVETAAAAEPEGACEPSGGSG